MSKLTMGRKFLYLHFVTIQNKRRKAWEVLVSKFRWVYNTSQMYLKLTEIAMLI